MSDALFVRADEPLQIAEGETYAADGRPLALDFTSVLGDATIASIATPTVTPTGATVTAAANTATYVDDGRTVAIGKAAMLAVSGQSVGRFTVRLTVTDTDGEVRVGEVRVEVQ
jgi:hypothetical protein